MDRTNYAVVAGRAKRLANALRTLGVEFGQPAATLAWNSFCHLGLYYGVIGSGRIRGVKTFSATMSMAA
jgi:fatty-acyl-CoA synthase